MFWIVGDVCTTDNLFISNNQKESKGKKMVDECEVGGTLTDFVTGAKVADTIMERIRQRIERFLVESKNYSKGDIEVGKEFETVSEGGSDGESEIIRSQADLIVRAGDKRVIVIKCTCGSLLAKERLVLSYTRLLDPYQIPFAVVTNGEDAEVLDAISGQTIGSGLEAIPSINIEDIEFTKLSEDRIEKEKRILAAFESIDETTCVGGRR